MSGQAGHPGGVGGEGGDPSMEDILASIRRILSEDEAQPEPPAHSPPASSLPVPPSAPPPALRSEPHVEPPHPPPEVLTLDPSMLVEEPEPEPEPFVEPEPPPPAIEEHHVDPPPPPAVMSEHQPERTGLAAPSPSPSLVAPEAAAAAASSVGSLLRTIGARQGVAVRTGGPTIEDMVREELRPALKAWLDTHLPPMVERLVRAEIERLVGRADI